jgi:hypothetical protein
VQIDAFELGQTEELREPGNIAGFEQDGSVPPAAFAAARTDELLWNFLCFH